MEPFKLERYFSQYEFNTKYLMCSSDCESFSVEQLLMLEDSAYDEFLQIRLGYTETSGSPALRAEISSLYNSISHSNVLVHNGGEEVIYNFFRSMLQAGDHVIVQTPCYQSHSEIPLAIGCTISNWEMKVKEGKWDLSLDDLERSIRSNTKVLVICFPNNPTGYQPSLEFYEKIFEIARDHDIVVFSDEAYRDAEYKHEDKLPYACDIDPHAVSLGLLSKAFGMAGLRIGWVASQNDSTLEKILMYKDYTSICNSATSAFLGTLALRNRKVILKRNVDILLSNKLLLDNFFLRHRNLFSWYPPDAGPVAFPKYVQGDVNDFCDQLVKNCGILLLPGTVYNSTENCFRIGFGRMNMPEALNELENYLSRLD